MRDRTRHSGTGVKKGERTPRQQSQRNTVRETGPQRPGGSDTDRDWEKAARDKPVDTMRDRALRDRER